MVGQHRCGRTGCASRSAPARVPARPVAFLLVWFVLGDCKGLDRTAGGVFWAPAVYVAYFVGRMVGRRET